MNPRMITVSIALTFAASCVKEDKSVSISDAIHQRANLDGKRVLVRGYIEVDALDYPAFVEERGPINAERITESLDLVPNDDEVQKRLIKSNGECIVADGRFHLYGSNEVRLGNLVSKYGLVAVRDIRKCMR